VHFSLHASKNKQNTFPAAMAPFISNEVIRHIINDFKDLDVLHAGLLDETTSLFHLELVLLHDPLALFHPNFPKNLWDTALEMVKRDFDLRGTVSPQLVFLDEKRANDIKPKLVAMLEKDATFKYVGGYLHECVPECLGNLGAGSDGTGQGPAKQAKKLKRTDPAYWADFEKRTSGFENDVFKATFTGLSAGIFDNFEHITCDAWFYPFVNMPLPRATRVKHLREQFENLEEIDELEGVTPEEFCNAFWSMSSQVVDHFSRKDNEWNWDKLPDALRDSHKVQYLLSKLLALAKDQS
jgi:hypothetical protein